MEVTKGLKRKKKKKRRAGSESPDEDEEVYQRYRKGLFWMVLFFKFRGARINLGQKRNWQAQSFSFSIPAEGSSSN